MRVQTEQVSGEEGSARIGVAMDRWYPSRCSPLQQQCPEVRGQPNRKFNSKRMQTTMLASTLFANEASSFTQFNPTALASDEHGRIYSCTSRPLSSASLSLVSEGDSLNKSLQRAADGFLEVRFKRSLYA